MFQGLADVDRGIAISPKDTFQEFYTSIFGGREEESDE